MTPRLLPATAMALLLSALPVAAPGGENPVEEGLAASARDGAFHPLAPEEERRLEALFLQSLTGNVDHQAWRGAGFLSRPLEGNLLALEELENRGRGFHLFRGGAPRALFLQMPHRFADLHTGEIGARLFTLANARGASWNTRPRRDPKAVGGAESDLSHIPRSLFSVHARAVARAFPQAIILQLHGFAADKRSTPRGASAGIIVSSGTHTPSRAARDLVQCLDGAGFNGVRLFPRDVEELGGTTNVTGQALRSMGSDGFLHMEISHDLRKTLLKDDLWIGRMAACLAEL